MLPPPLPPQPTTHNEPRKERANKVLHVIHASSMPNCPGRFDAASVAWEVRPSASARATTPSPYLKIFSNDYALPLPQRLGTRLLRGHRAKRCRFSPTAPASLLQHRGIHKNSLSAGQASAFSTALAGAEPNIHTRAAILALALQISGAPRIDGHDPERKKALTCSSQTPPLRTEAKHISKALRMNRSL